MKIKAEKYQIKFDDTTVVIRVKPDPKKNLLKITKTKAKPTKKTPIAPEALQNILKVNPFTDKETSAEAIIPENTHWEKTVQEFYNEKENQVQLAIQNYVNQGFKLQIDLNGRYHFLKGKVADLTYIQKTRKKLQEEGERIQNAK